MSVFSRHTRSVCPICLEQVDATLTERDGAVYMDKRCGAHGAFSVPVWRNGADMAGWLGAAPPLAQDENTLCPSGCAACGGHTQQSCCVLLEVTPRCNLHCAYCFADGEGEDPSLDELKAAIVSIKQPGNTPLLQLSGGEPTLRDDLPDIVSWARRQGYEYIQLNSNGLRLAEDEPYMKALADAGLAFVFLQFDGVDDAVYESLRGRPLLDTKQKAIRMAGKYNVGVTLVPTVVRGVNDGQIGRILAYAARLSPVVRGVHFQPVSYFGRYPHKPDDGARYTLDELISALETQAGVAPETIVPSRCDHPLCGFHGSFVAREGELIPLSKNDEPQACETSPAQNRVYIGSRWKRSAGAICCCEAPDLESMDGFLEGVRHFGFTITAMAFQDAMNLDIERLSRCSLHVYDGGVLRPFCSRYLTPMEDA